MSHVDAALPADELPMPTRRTCAALEEHRRLLNEDPAYAARRAAIETMTWEFQTGARRLERAGVTRIPVVVHVVWNAQAQNISDAQVQSQIDVLNRDFRKTNADSASVPTVWNTLAADARIEFFLATADPNGNPTTGITRTQTATTSFPYAGNPVKGSATGGGDPWPADRYLNIWVCRLHGGLLGYAEFPGAPASIDGVVITDTAFGTAGTATAPFDRGRTATHEIGHWLNLFHIWGDDGTGCAGNDGADDSPNQAGPNYSCPTFPSISCDNGPNGDMFMNFMDYTDDACMFMFTAGQMMRMQATLDGPRSTLGLGAPVQQIDAALYSGSKNYFFAGNQYIRVTRGDAGAGTVDPGYPKPISTWGWPAGFGANGIDAALYSHTKCYFFAGNQYIRMTRGDAGSGAVDAGYPKPIANWGWPAGFGANGIDAALYSRGKNYFFAGNQYLRVTRDDAGRGTVDPGYPKAIANWSWPAGFGANGIDAALYSGSKNYFFAGNQYIRVTRGDVSRGTVDPGYPKPIANWGWPDF